MAKLTLRHLQNKKKRYWVIPDIEYFLIQLEKMEELWQNKKDEFYDQI